MLSCGPGRPWTSCDASARGGASPPVGLRCYPSLEAIPEPIDLAVIVVPARAVEPVLAALPPGHVKFALMITSGFGPMVVFGAGGRLVDLLRDVQLRPAPLPIGQAFEMIERSSIHPLLAGYRDGPKRDVAALVDTLMRISSLAETS